MRNSPRNLYIRITHRALHWKDLLPYISIKSFASIITGERAYHNTNHKKFNASENGTIWLCKCHWYESRIVKISVNVIVSHTWLRKSKIISHTWLWKYKISYQERRYSVSHQVTRSQKSCAVTARRIVYLYVNCPVANTSDYRISTAEPIKFLVDLIDSLDRNYIKKMSLLLPCEYYKQRDITN